jgi:putative lipoprotein (rSAM/lipoprotein system)
LQSGKIRIQAGCIHAENSTFAFSPILKKRRSMKRMNRSLIKGTNRILSGILALLGFPGCTENEPAEEYGTPYATFTFQGTVADKAGNPVKDIKIEAGRPGEEHAESLGLTHETGRYSVTFQTYPGSDFQLIASDIDGEANGSFLNDTVPVRITKDDYYEQGQGWNSGSAAKEVNITLEEKEPSQL